MIQSTSMILFGLSSRDGEKAPRDQGPTCPVPETDPCKPGPLLPFPSPVSSAPSSPLAQSPNPPLSLHPWPLITVSLCGHSLHPLANNRPRLGCPSPINPHDPSDKSIIYLHLPPSSLPSVSASRSLHRFSSSIAASPAARDEKEVVHPVLTARNQHANPAARWPDPRPAQR